MLANAGYNARAMHGWRGLFLKLQLIVTGFQVFLSLFQLLIGILPSFYVQDEYYDRLL